MAEKQALNATFFAFRKREKSGVLLGASLAYLVFTVAIVSAFGFLNAQGFVDYINWITNLGATMGTVKPGAAPSPDMMMPPQSVMALAPAYLLFLLVAYVLLASYEAACLRWMIRGETGGVFGLSLGADTWRVYFGYWVWFFLLIAFYIACAILAGGAIFSLVSMTRGDLSNAGPATALVPFAMVLLLLIGLIYFGVRFAPAAATSIARRRFAFFDAWTVSKDRFWALLGAFVLLFLMWVVFYIIVAIGAGFAAASLVGSQLGQVSEPQSAQEALRAFANPQWLGMIAGFVGVMLIATMMLYVGMFGINARAAVAALEEGKIAKPA